MSFDGTHRFLSSLSRVEETLQWDSLVFWVGDKTVGGKMFAVLHPEPEKYVMAFAVPPESYHGLLELDGVRPAPYLARAHWVAVEGWTVFPARTLRGHLRAAHERVAGKLPRKAQRVLEGTDKEYRAAVREARAAARQPPGVKAAFFTSRLVSLCIY